jgi:hypothetical protein
VPRQSMVHHRSKICSFAMLLLFCGTLGAQTVKPVPPLRTFWVQSALPRALRETLTTVHRVLGHNGTLYFHLSPSFARTNSSIVQTTEFGKLTRIVQLPYSSEVKGFEVDPNGLIYVLLYNYKQNTYDPQLIIYNTDGTSVDETRGRHITAICSVGPTSVALTATASGVDVSSLDSQHQKRVSFALREPRRPFATVGLPDGRLAVVERTAGVVHFVHLEQQSEASFMPRVPEMAWLGTIRSSNSLRNVAFADVAAAPDGTLYLLLGNYRLTEGAPVVSFHMNGNVAETKRYELPRSERVPDERMIPTHITVSDASTLILVSARGKVAVYPL